MRRRLWPLLYCKAPISGESASVEIVIPVGAVGVGVGDGVGVGVGVTTDPEPSDPEPQLASAIVDESSTAMKIFRMSTSHFNNIGYRRKLSGATVDDSAATKLTGSTRLGRAAFCPSSLVRFGTPDLRAEAPSSPALFLWRFRRTITPRGLQRESALYGGSRALTATQKDAARLSARVTGRICWRSLLVPSPSPRGGARPASTSRGT